MRDAKKGCGCAKKQAALKKLPKYTKPMAKKAAKKK